MKFHSLRNPAISVSLKEATLKGLAPDGSLYMPDKLQPLPKAFFNNIGDMSITDIAYIVANILIGTDIEASKLKRIVEETFTYDIPLRRIDSNIWALELFHGPTGAFKDTGARFLARLVSHFSESAPINVLVATSGDSGGAVAAGFHRVKGVNVIVLYPQGVLSTMQRQQFCNLSGNITAVEVNGTFDQCQALVKQALIDTSLTESKHFTSANSINVMRLIPQMFYYFHAYSRLIRQNAGKHTDIVMSVPCGNLGNLAAGLLAKQMGLPISRFIASTNSNDTLVRYLATADYLPKPLQRTIARAMDVADPSNMARILSLYNSDINALQRDLVALKFTDRQIADCILDTFCAASYLTDPHSATALLGLRSTLTEHQQGIFLCTAHPAKFAETVAPIIGHPVQTPSWLMPSNNVIEHPVHYRISANYPAFKRILQNQTA